jgi:nucleotide-binding universal stress UspA family protein
LVFACGEGDVIEIKNILCPVDFSEFSRHAIDHAVTIARWYGARVTALHVLPPLAAGMPATDAGLPPFVFTPNDLRQFQAELASFVSENRGDARVDSKVVEGSLTGEIVRLARELPADLIVMGTHGRSGFERLLLGSVTEKMLRKTPCPLLTVPARAPAALPDKVLFTDILCAVDFSPSSLRALTFAESLAKEADARLTVLHVLEPVYALAGTPAMNRAETTFDPELRRAATVRLQETISDEARTYCHVREIVTFGKPYREILREAAEQRCNLVVMGAHGGGLDLLAFGSTTNHVVREATCPVLTLRAP